MAKANKSVFDSLIETTEYVYELRNGSTYTFVIHQLTLGDIAEISTIKDEDKAEIELIARSLKNTVDEVKDIPASAVVGLVKVILEFNNLDDEAKEIPAKAE